MNEYSSVTWEHATSYQKPLCTVEFKWKIENFSLLPKVVDTFYDSPQFSYGGTEWCVRLFPNGESLHSSEGWIALYLSLIKGKTILKNFSCVFSIVKINGEKEYQKGFYLIFLTDRCMQGLKNFLEKDKLIRRKSKFYPSDTLNISVWLQYENPEHLIRKYC